MQSHGTILKETYFRHYAQSFWEELKKELWIMAPSLQYLPIVFVDSVMVKQKVSNYTYGEQKIHENEKTHHVSACPIIYLHDFRSEEEIKQTIRHEIVHYLLFQTHIHHEDDSVLFWLVCDLFDGAPYEQLSKEKQRLFDIAKPVLTALHNQNALKTSLLLTEIDEIEDNISEESLKNFSVIVRAITHHHES